MVASLKYLAGAFLLTLVCVGAVSVLGPFALFLNLFAACPVAYAAWRSGLAPALGAVLLVALSLWLMSGPGNAIAYLLQFGSGALLLGLLLRRGFAWDRSAALAILATLLLAAAVFLAYSIRQGSSGLELADRIVKSEIDRSIAVLQQDDLSATERSQMEQMFTQVAGFLQRTWPGLTVAFIGVTLMTALYLLSIVARNWQALPGPDFTAWKSPELLVWPLIAAGFAYFFTEGAVATAALNLLVVLLPVYFLHGLAVISYFFQAKGIAPFFRSIGYTLAVLLNPLPLLVTMLGLFDLWADFRKPRIKNT